VLKTFSSDKRKHKTLSAKAEIIKKLDNGEKLINLAKEYDVGCATIYDIRKNRGKFKCFVKNIDSGPSDRQTLKSGEYPGHPRDQNVIQFVKAHYKNAFYAV
jgi:hypothetical protein